MSLAMGWLLAGCSTLSSVNPVNWWHRQEGGKIAEQRPAPPGADQPYPNLSTVPSRPEPPDAEALKKLTASLVADRTNAQHAAQSAPLADPSLPNTSPGLFGVGTAPPPPPRSDASPASSTPPAGAPASTGPATASASMPAVTAPPPSAAPRKPVQSAPLEAPAGAEPAQAAAAGATPVATQPALPAGPPPRPAAAGAPPAEPVMPAPMPAPPPSGPSASIVFLEGAADLSQPAADEVKVFAGKRGNSTIGVTGYGESASSDPEAQSAALNLGLSRAQAIVEALKSAGVPSTAIRVGAEASGRGASLRLLK